MKLWETPFTNNSFPAVQVIPSNEAAGEVDILVYPTGLGTFPVYLVNFNSVPAYRSHYEGMIPSSWKFPPENLQSKCSFTIENSDWIEDFQNSSAYIEESFGEPFSSLNHYVIIGGDNIIEVLSFGAEIERIDESRIVREFTV